MAMQNMSFKQDKINGLFAGIPDAIDLPRQYTDGLYSCGYCPFWPLVNEAKWEEFPDLTQFGSLPSFGLCDGVAQFHASPLYNKLRDDPRAYYCVIVGLKNANTYPDYIPKEYGPYFGAAVGERLENFLTQPLRTTRVNFGYYSVFKMNRNYW